MPETGACVVGHMPGLSLARHLCTQSHQENGNNEPRAMVVPFSQTFLLCAPDLFQIAQEEVGNILAFFIPSVACIVQVGAVPDWVLLETAGSCLRER